MIVIGKWNEMRNKNCYLGWLRKQKLVLPPLFYIKIFYHKNDEKKWVISFISFYQNLESFLENNFKSYVISYYIFP